MSDILEVYGTHRPTPFDATGDVMLPDRASWYILPVSRTRDSGVLARVNFEVARDTMPGEEGDGWEVHRFGHWGPGWYEVILIDPDNAAAVAVAEDIAAALAHYPVLDDVQYSEAEEREACETWANMTIRERIDAWRQRGQRRGASIFSVRADVYPEWASEYLRE